MESKVFGSEATARLDSLHRAAQGNNTSFELPPAVMSKLKLADGKTKAPRIIFQVEDVKAALRASQEVDEHDSLLSNPELLVRKAMYGAITIVSCRGDSKTTDWSVETKESNLAKAKWLMAMDSVAAEYKKEKEALLKGEVAARAAAPPAPLRVTAGAKRPRQPRLEGGAEPTETAATGAAGGGGASAAAAAAPSNSNDGWSSDDDPSDGSSAQRRRLASARKKREQDEKLRERMLDMMDSGKGGFDADVKSLLEGQAERQEKLVNAIKAPPEGQLKVWEALAASAEAGAAARKKKEEAEQKKQAERERLGSMTVRKSPRCLDLCAWADRVGLCAGRAHLTRYPGAATRRQGLRDQDGREQARGYLAAVGVPGGHAVRKSSALGFRCASSRQEPTSSLGVCGLALSSMRSWSVRLQVSAATRAWRRRWQSVASWSSSRSTATATERPTPRLRP